MTRDEHMRAMYIVGSAKRGKRDGLIMLCSGPECAGAEVFVPGRTAAAVEAAAVRHILNDNPDLLRGWRCMVCGDSDRPFGQISVAHRPALPEHHGLGYWNVSYCNDRVDCVVAANADGPWAGPPRSAG